MKKFCENLREHVIKIINYEKKKIVPLTRKEKKCASLTKMLYIQKRI